MSDQNIAKPPQTPLPPPQPNPPPPQQPNPEPRPSPPPYDRYPPYRPPYYPPRSNVPWWLYERYNDYPQTIVVRQPAATIPTVVQEQTAQDIPKPIDNFASMWPLLLSIALTLLLVIVALAMLGYVGRFIYKLLKPMHADKKDNIIQNE